MRKIPGDEGHIASFEGYRFSFDLHDAAIRIAYTNLQMVMEMEMFTFNIGNLPTLTA
ncbi:MULTISPECIES: hypothetical protein [Paenibacillus]|jgi:hypothetical protein|uniref:hypothetical protein n=1 Tax=Paenibacillus TaxID=44249 RepID=UPI001F400E6D|nr:MULTISPECIES: hypothetical protein [Paenibacillus]MCP3747132.1 hypothetical protein [Paenibacillus sp. A3M_27_13]